MVGTPLSAVLSGFVKFASLKSFSPLSVCVLELEADCVAQSRLLLLEQFVGKMELAAEIKPRLQSFVLTSNYSSNVCWFALQPVDGDREPLVCVTAAQGLNTNQ